MSRRGVLRGTSGHEKFAIQPDSLIKNKVCSDTLGDTCWEANRDYMVMAFALRAERCAVATGWQQNSNVCVSSACCLARTAQQHMLRVTGAQN